MSDYHLLCTIRLSAKHASTESTRHHLGNTELPAHTELRIMQYPEDSGYYLLYCNKDGAEITDTYHDSANEAKSQAQFEFNVKPEEWETVNG